MYRILTFASYTWAVADFEFDCLEDAMAGVNSIPNHGPWRIQEWIDIRNGPASAGFWRDAAYWLDGYDPAEKACKAIVAGEPWEQKPSWTQVPA